MLLLTFKTWDGPSDPRDPTRESVNGVEAFATLMPLGAALLGVRDYERAFNAWSLGTAVVFSLIGVASIQTLNDEQCRAGRLRLVEELAKAAADFDAEVAARTTKE